MTRADFNLAMMSPSRRAGTIIRSTKLTLEADLLLPTVAAECGHESVSDFSRHAWEFYAEAKKAAHAAALRVAMQTGKHAEDLKGAAVGTILAISFFILQIAGGNDVRKSRTVVGVRIVRNANGGRVKEEIV